MLQLRNRYNLEKRRLEQLREENPEKPVESPWPLYEMLHFLSDHIRARRSYKRMFPMGNHSSADLDNSQGSNPMSPYTGGVEASQGRTRNNNYDNNEMRSMHNNTMPAIPTYANGFCSVKLEENDTEPES